MWQLAVQQWLVVMIVIAATTVLGAFVVPRLRPWIPLLVPVTLGLSCGLIAVRGLAESGRTASAVLFDRPLAQALGLPDGGGVLLGLVIGLAGAWAAFRCEAALLRWRPARRTPTPGLPLGGASLPLPGRSESMKGVAAIARRPGLFLAVSVLSATGEELLFRGAMLSGLAWHLPAVAAGMLGLQAVLFAGTHVAFGWRTMLGKVLLGLALGLGAAFAGLLLGALLPHLAYQVRVLAQFRPLTRRTPHHA